MPRNALDMIAFDGVIGIGVYTAQCIGYDCIGWVVLDWRIYRAICWI